MKREWGLLEASAKVMKREWGLLETPANVDEKLMLV